jgi:UDP-glucuronate 4-epimerase
VALLDFIGALERAFGREAAKTYLPMQAGDAPATAADTTALENWIGPHGCTSLAEGVRRFAHWYLEHYAQAVEATS